MALTPIKGVMKDASGNPLYFENSSDNVKRSDGTTIEAGLAAAEKLAKTQGQTLTTVSGKADTNAQAIETANGKIAANEKLLGTHTSDISGVKGRLDTAEGTIGTHTSDISGVKGRLDTAEGSISKNAGDIVTANGKITANEEAITALQEALAGKAPVDIKATIAERDQIEKPLKGQQVWVLDASSDPSVKSGAALYLYNSSAWVKMAEVESMDIKHKWSDIENKEVDFGVVEHGAEKPANLASTGMYFEKAAV